MKQAKLFAGKRSVWLPFFLKAAVQTAHRAGGSAAAEQDRFGCPPRAG